MAMTGDVKTGLMVSGAFASLVGAVLTKHYVSPDELLGHKAPTEQVASAESDAKVPSGVDAVKTAESTPPAPEAIEGKSEVVLASANGAEKGGMPPAPVPGPGDLMPPPPPAPTSTPAAGDTGATPPTPPMPVGSGDKPMDPPVPLPPPTAPGGLPPLEDKKSAETLAPPPPPGAIGGLASPMPDSSKLAEGLAPALGAGVGASAANLANNGSPMPALTKPVDTLVPPPPAPAAGGLVPPVPPITNVGNNGAPMPELAKPMDTTLAPSAQGLGGLAPPAPNLINNGKPMADLTKPVDTLAPPTVPAAMAPLGGFGSAPPSGLNGSSASGNLGSLNETFPSEPGKPGISRVLTFTLDKGPEKRSESIPLDEPGFPVGGSVGAAPPTGIAPSQGTGGVGLAPVLPPSGVPGNMSARPAESRPAAFVPVDGRNVPVLTMPADPGVPRPITPGSIPVAPAAGPGNPSVGFNAPAAAGAVGTGAVIGTGLALNQSGVNGANNNLNNQMNSAANDLNKNLNNAAGNLNSSVNGLNNSLDSTVSGLNKNLNNAGTNLNNSLTNTVSGLNNQVNSAAANLGNTVNGTAASVSSWTEHPYKVLQGDSWDKISQAQYGTPLYAATLKTFNQTHPRSGEALAKDGSPVVGQEVYLLPLDQIRKLTTAPSP